MKVLFALALGCAVSAAHGQSITILASPSWGSVMEPSSGSASYTLSATTGLVNNLTGLGFVFGGGGAGQYLVTGQILRSISFGVTIGAFSGSGVTVTAAYINGTSASGSGSLSVLGTLTLSIGGVLKVASFATAGSHIATVTVTVNYS